MQAWAGFAGAAAIVIAAWIGSRTFETWLLQRQTERQLEAGERILTVIYRAQDIFRTIRSPAQWPNEIDEATETLRKNAPSFDGEDTPKKHRLQLSQIMMNRIAAQNDYWKEFWELVPVSRVHFGEEFEKSFRIIWAMRARITSSAMTYYNIQPERSIDLYRQCESDFWDGVGHASGKDEIAAALEGLAATANQVILPKLRPARVTTPPSA
jgi:hypothetical protein